MKVLLKAIILIVISCNIIADSNISTQNVEVVKNSVQEHAIMTNSFAVESIPKIKIEMSQPVNWYLILLPITTIVIVIVGFLITRVQIIRKSEESIQTSRMEVLSKNRQTWINTLREDISKFIGKVDLVEKNILIYHLDKSSEKDKKFEPKDVILTANPLYELKSKIELLINPYEEKHIELIKLLSLTIENIRKRETNAENITKITILAQQILKEEWQRVKKGD